MGTIQNYLVAIATKLRYHSFTMEGKELQNKIHEFVRKFGLLGPRMTPCGQKIRLTLAHILMILLEEGTSDNSISHVYLARKIGINKSNIKRPCDDMENVGLLQQIPSELDLRRKKIILTSKGKRLAKILQKNSSNCFHNQFKQIPKHERANVLSAIDVLVNALGAFMEINDES